MPNIPKSTMMTMPPLSSWHFHSAPEHVAVPTYHGLAAKAALMIGVWPCWLNLKNKEHLLKENLHQLIGSLQYSTICRLFKKLDLVVYRCGVEGTIPRG